jgi:hypothetical protein
MMAVMGWDLTGHERGEGGAAWGPVDGHQVIALPADLQADTSGVVYGWSAAVL